MKNFSKQFSFIAIALFMIDASVANAQSLIPQTISSGGGFLRAEGYSLSRTIGEMSMIKTFFSQEVTLTQGFQQSESKKTVNIDDFSDNGGAISLFPNPANDIFNLKYVFPQTGKLQIIIFNALGQQISQNFSDLYNAGEKTFTVHTENLVTGIYYVNALFVSENGKQYVFNQKLEVIK